MGKYSNLERKPRDYYPTPKKGVPPLLDFLRPGLRFAEPCAGAGDLVGFLEAAGLVCAGAWDIEPQAEGIEKADAMKRVVGNIDMYITNPPWKDEILLPLIVHLSNQAPTWLLLSADFAYNVQSAPVMARCTDVVPVGRLKWIPGSKHTGKENCAWYRFENGLRAGAGPILHPRKPARRSR